MNKKTLFLSFLPEWARIKAINCRLAWKRAALRVSKSPSALTFFVTSKCNLKCAHCFYWKELNAETAGELSPEEIEKIMPSIKKRVSLALTGGEPFLRKDLPEICGLFTRYDKVREIGIVTNGYEPENIISKCEKILSIIEVPLSIQVSLDGLDTTHDWIRGMPGSFRRAVETLQRFKALRKINPDKFKFSAAFTVQKRNYREIDAFIDYMLSFKIPLGFMIARGEKFGLYNLPAEVSSHIGPREEEGAQLPLSELEEVFRKIAKKNNVSTFKFWENKKRKIIEISLKILKERAKQLPCYAGRAEGVLYSNGDLAFCEFMKPIGNLRQCGYDFHSLWNSANAGRLRKLTEKCYCIHSCSLGTSILLNEPEIVNEIISSRNKT